ncbi:MAG: cytochrome-c peroxidase [Kiritimatiellia bacterium]
MNRGNARCVVAGAIALAVLAVAGVFAAHVWGARRRAAEQVEARKAFLARFGIDSDGRGDFVALPPSLPHAVGPAKLGEDLFYDRRLAQSQRRTCAACHQLNEGGVDGELHGGVLTRTVMNASFSPIFLKDGSLTNLADVVAQMIARSDRAGGGDLEKVVRKLGADGKMLARFRACYEDGLTSANLLDALVQYNRTLLSPRSPFDRYWGGATNALDASQKMGMDIFKRRNCLSCHDGPALGGLRVSNGRKVPVLRGIGARRVYLSDGSRNDLGAVLTVMPGGDVEAAERAALVSFLKSL